MRKVDIHNHLGRNGDNPGFDETIDIVHRRLGDGGVFGIANSDDYRFEIFVSQGGGRYNRVPVSDGRAFHVPEKDMLVVKCQEMFTEKGHVLAIAMPFCKNIVSKNTNDAIRETLDLGAVLDAVHPHYKDGIGEYLEHNIGLLQLFSTFEVFNGSAIWIPGFTPKDANETALYSFDIINAIDKSTSLSLKGINIDFGMSASSDSHSVESIGKCYTLLGDFSSLSGDLPRVLDTEFRRVKSLDKLHQESNRWDVLNHYKNMLLGKVGLMK